jgi:glycine cleavage system H lipoate-binding protein/ActR/RegA family two-component response regulator
MPETRDALLLEDEPVARAATARALAALALDADQAEDLPGAYHLLGSRGYRLILADLMLPGSRRADVLSLVREFAPRLPVIVITGSATSDHAVESFRAGAFDFLPKPYTLEELSGTAQRAVNATAPQGRPWADLRALPPSPRGVRHFLNRHSWVEARADGTCVIGAGSHVSGLMGPVGEMLFAPLKGSLYQGDLCVRIVSSIGYVHQVWSPLSGTIVEINDAVRKDAALIDRDPFGEGWLIRIIPNDFELESRSLLPAVLER